MKITASFIPTKSGPPHVNFLVDLEGGVDEDLTPADIAGMFGKAMLDALTGDGISMIHRAHSLVNPDNGDHSPLCPEPGDSPTGNEVS